MKYAYILTLLSIFFLLCSCTMFDSKQSAKAPLVPPAQLGKTVGKNWQIIEEAPIVADERGHVSFQMEESVEPDGVNPVLTGDKVKVEMSR